MSDIVQRLRIGDTGHGCEQCLRDEAADHIEQQAATIAEMTRELEAWKRSHIAVERNKLELRVDELERVIEQLDDGSNVWYAVLARKTLGKARAASPEKEERK